MIKVGTLCYVNSRAQSSQWCIGDVVTVLSPLIDRDVGLSHQISMPPSFRGDPKVPWYARPIYLTPISDPDQTQDERHDNEVTA